MGGMESGANMTMGTLLSIYSSLSPFLPVVSYLLLSTALVPIILLLLIHVSLHLSLCS